MYEGLSISTPFTESWLGWMMLLLLLLLGTANIFQPGMYARAFESLPNSKERDSIFVAAGKDNRSHILFSAYGIVVLGLFCRWCFFNADHFTFTSCAISIGCCAIAIGLRKGIQHIVAFTFFNRHELDTIWRHYRYINECTAIALYPILLIALYTAVPRIAILVVVGILMVAYFGFILFKMLACMPLAPSALLLLPIYLFTVEVLPIAGMFYAIQRLIV